MALPLPNICSVTPNYIYNEAEVFARMVFCRECKKKVDDCEHFVSPLGVATVPVFDPKIKTLAYNANARILEIAFKNGQTWQLAGVEPVMRSSA
jgi:hypothetical protein